MAYSQQTTHYGLPLPTSGDKSTFLDTNDAFGRIDSDIYEAKTNATAAVQDIGQIQLDISQLQASTLEMQTDISQLTSRQTISETNITALQSAMTTAQTDVAKLQNDYGTTDISGIGDGTVTGAIASIATKEYVEVTTDGVETYGQALNRLFALVDFTKVSEDTKLVAFNGAMIMSLQGYGAGTVLTFTMGYAGLPGITAISMHVKSAASEYITISGTSTITDGSSTVTSAGEKLRIIY